MTRGSARPRLASGGHTSVARDTAVIHGLDKSRGCGGRVPPASVCARSSPRTIEPLPEEQAAAV